MSNYYRSISKSIGDRERIGGGGAQEAGGKTGEAGVQRGREGREKWKTMIFVIY